MGDSDKMIRNKLGNLSALTKEELISIVKQLELNIVEVEHQLRIHKIYGRQSIIKMRADIQDWKNKYKSQNKLITSIKNDNEKIIRYITDIENFENK
jgi:hypothetical protein